MYIINLTVMQQSSNNEVCGEVENFSFNVDKNFQKEFVSRDMILNYFKGLVLLLDDTVIASISQALDENSWLFDFKDERSLNYRLKNVESILVEISRSLKDDIIEVNEKIMCISQYIEITHF